MQIISKKKEILDIFKYTKISLKNFSLQTDHIKTCSEISKAKKIPENLKTFFCLLDEMEICEFCISSTHNFKKECRLTTPENLQKNFLKEIENLEQLISWQKNERILKANDLIENIQKYFLSFLSKNSKKDFSFDQEISKNFSNLEVKKIQNKINLFKKNENFTESEINLLKIYFDFVENQFFYKLSLRLQTYMDLDYEENISVITKGILVSCEKNEKIRKNFDKSLQLQKQMQENINKEIKLKLKLNEGKESENNFISGLYKKRSKFVGGNNDNDLHIGKLKEFNDCENANDNKENKNKENLEEINDNVFQNRVENLLLCEYDFDSKSAENNNLFYSKKTKSIYNNTKSNTFTNNNSFFKKNYNKNNHTENKNNKENQDQNEENKETPIILNDNNNIINNYKNFNNIYLELDLENENVPEIFKQNKKKFIDTNINNSDNSDSQNESENKNKNKEISIETNNNNNIYIKKNQISNEKEKENQIENSFKSKSISMFNYSSENENSSKLNEISISKNKNKNIFEEKNKNPENFIEDKIQIPENSILYNDTFIVHLLEDENSGEENSKNSKKENPIKENKENKDNKREIFFLEENNFEKNYKKDVNKFGFAYTKYNNFNDNFNKNDNNSNKSENLHIDENLNNTIKEIDSIKADFEELNKKREENKENIFINNICNSSEQNNKSCITNSNSNNKINQTQANSNPNNLNRNKNVATSNFATEPYGHFFNNMNMVKANQNFRNYFYQQNLMLNYMFLNNKITLNNLMHMQNIQNGVNFNNPNLMNYNYQLNQMMLGFPNFNQQQNNFNSK